MAHDRFKAKVAALDALRLDATAAEALPLIRKALHDKNAFVVAKAATIARETYAIDALPEIVAAFERLLTTGSEDPGCRAKDAIAKALKELGERNPAPFLAGLACVQMEPVWGGSVDTAGPLRGTCAQALVACDIEPTALLTALTDHFVDTDKWVRVDIARAVAQLDRPESALLLRLKALCGDAEPEVLGQCFTSLLELAPHESPAFVARFLEAKNEDVCLEAASALAISRSIEALRAVIRFWEQTNAQTLREAIAGTLAGSPHPESAEFLLGVVRSHADGIGCAAVRAMSASRFRNEFRSRLAEAVERAGSDRLERAFAEHFS